MRNMALFTLILLVVGSQIGCTKKRGESFVQGQGRDLLAISQFDGAEFEVETLDPIADFKENPKISKSEKVTQKAESSASRIVAVKVETKADLLADAPFIAVPRTKSGYKIKYQINSSYLVVLKVADKSLIHPRELPGAIAIDEKTVAVPIVGYPISGFFNSENVELNGEKSSKLMEVSEKDQKAASYFKIDKNNRMLYQLQEKQDLFTKEYFVGADGKSEWYFGHTIISAGGANADYAGWVLNQQDNELNGLSKIKFTFNRTEMQAISINKDKRLNNDEDIHQTVLVKLPIDWKEYRPVPKGSASFEMREEENTSIDGEKRRFVKIDFARAVMATLGGSDFRFVDLELDENYFSFTLYDPANNIRVKQAFMRDINRPKYTPKRMHKSDFEKFGFFDTQKHEIDNFEKYRREDYGKNVFINRFNVAQKKVTFYFTEGSDEKLIPAAAKAAEEWTAAFAAAGVPLVIEANTSQRVRLGDIRYNQINLIRSTIESNLFGYGPSITDPTTGEIISATTNMHITSIVSHLSHYIRNYIRYKSGQTKILAVVEPSLPTGGMKAKGDKILVEPTAHESQFLKKFPVVGANGQVQMKEVEFAARDEKKPSRTTKQIRREFDMGISGKYLNEEVDQLCPEINQAADALKKGTRLENENELVIACAEKLLPHKMFATVLHELGHNFGLRHNFYGSVDAMNFLSTEQTGTKDQVQSSSVMEYSAFSEDRLNKVGKYDIAAIRYGYGDSVETKDGKVLKLNVEKTIEENLKESGAVARPYMFCTDEDVAVGTDPLCARHDAGRNPDEIVAHLINEFNASIANSNYRFDRQQARDPMELTRGRLHRFWIPMKKIYDEWRYRLNDHLGLGNEYLENFDSEKLKAAIEKRTANCTAQTSNSEDCLFMHYRNAAHRIFKFATQMATLPPKYCIGERNGKVAAVEFSSVRGIIKNRDKFVAPSCMNETVKAYVLEKYGFTPEYESGYELEDVRLEMKVKMGNKTDWFGNPLPEPPDIIGLMPEKTLAMEFLTTRASLSMSSDEKPFRPNFLDEPQFREEVLAHLADRLSKGLKADRLLAASPKFKSKTAFLEKFKYEKKFIDEMTRAIIWGLDVPDKSTASRDRKKKFLVKLTDKKDILDKAKYKVPDLDGTTFYAIMTNEATEAKKLMEMLETLPKRLEAASPLDDNTFVVLESLAKEHLSLDDAKPDLNKFLEFMYMVLEDEYSEERLSGKLGVTAVRSDEKKQVDQYRTHWKKVLQKEAAAVRDVLNANTVPGASEGGEISNLFTSLHIDAERIRQLKDPASSDYQKEGEGQIKYDKMGHLFYKGPGYTLNQKTLKERIAAYRVQATQEQKSGDNEDIYNFDELKTQMDMILDVLRSMTY